jgi:hypothetical protein
MIEETKTEERKDVRAMQNTKIIIYGMPLELIHDKSLGPILEGREEYPFFGIVYCGFKTGVNEVRLQTPRLWYLRKMDVERTGKVEDFKWDGELVHYYEIDLETDIQEKHYEQVRLGEEISAKPRIFASKVMVRPEGGLDTNAIKGMTREELEESIANLIETKTRMSGGVSMMEPIMGSCNTWYQSYTKTRYNRYVVRDKSGADCDE